jgi:hypothetical protein
LSEVVAAHPPSTPASNVTNAKQMILFIVSLPFVLLWHQSLWACGCMAAMRHFERKMISITAGIFAPSR